MDFHCTEQHRVNDRVYLTFKDKAGVPIKLPDGRLLDFYVDATAWDEDPEAVVAERAEYFRTQSSPPLEIAPTVGAQPVKMTDADVDAKLDMIAEEKAAAVEAKRDPAEKR